MKTGYSRTESFVKLSKQLFCDNQKLLEQKTETLQIIHSFWQHEFIDRWFSDDGVIVRMQSVLTKSCSSQYNYVNLKLCFLF